MAASPESKLKAAVTRSQNQVNKVTQEYGAHDIPKSHPLYEKKQKAQQQHREARKALREYQEGN